ncbi:MAG: gliding motility protein GldL [Bacteroidaceae bacterium]|jgi:archaellum component FlaC|nr:gliding motility protein GldL [Bacteroidaceae bacterium]MBR6170265.1 gliding motility protein GldL [Bacteroidaceae bacterium]
MNPIIKLQKWMDSPAGQLFMNYAYSWGASVVILGALFKLTHITGANVMLFIGMIVEAIVFFISGFEKTYEKTPKTEGAEAIGGPTVVVAGGGGTPLPEGAEIPEGPIVIGGGAPVIGGGSVIAGGAPVIGGGSVIAGGAPVGNIDPDALAAGTGLSAAAANLAAAGQAAAQAQLALEQIQNGGPTIDPNQIKATDPAVIEEAVKNYAEELTELTEVLGRVKAQAARMSTDSEEMENLNRTLTGIATVYELQLRNISKQVSTIEQIDEQTRKMAQQIQELNEVYSRMIKALTVNMGPVMPEAKGEE